MIRSLFRVSLFCLVAVCLSGCLTVVAPPPIEDPGYPPGGHGDRRAYRLGVTYGARDAAAELRADSQRHAHVVAPAALAEFRIGYRDGYERNAEDRPADVGEGPEAYRNGYRRGQNDAEAGLRSNYRRHQGSYLQRYEAEFRRGYDRGYPTGVVEEGPGVDSRADYHRGFSHGERDRSLGRSPNYRRHLHEYARDGEMSFRRGYDDGYTGRIVR
ncbi:MAG: hypothetical protein ACR2OZ_13355 [Verrucomicrobiales bacterium]